MAALGDVDLHQLFGDMSAIKGLELAMGDAVYFIFRNVDVYFWVVVDNSNGNRLDALIPRRPCQGYSNT